MIRLPQGIAARFALLLLLALLGANIVAALLLAREGSDYDRAVRMQGDMGRLVALVAALEQSDAQTGAALVEDSSTGFTRFSLDAAALAPSAATPALDVQAQVERALPDHMICIVDGSEVEPSFPRPVLTILSVQLNKGVYSGQWLNSLVYPLSAQAAWQWKIGFFVPLAVSLAATLAVGLVFVRRMTEPLRRLADGALAAGRGDRSIRVPETGAREFRDAAAAFNGMQQRIADFDAERMRMVAAIGHDLRTPITSLRIRAEMLDHEEEREAMIRILDQIGVMANDLLHYARAASGGEARARVDVGELIRHLCAERGVKLGHAHTVWLTLRRVAIARAVGNLIDNAVRYGGSAVVCVRECPGGVAITVEDRGLGIPDHQLDAISEPFVRGETSRSTETGGVGLGLSIAKGIAIDHGGRLELSNRPQGGLRAVIWLPAQP